MFNVKTFAPDVGIAIYGNAIVIVARARFQKRVQNFE